MVKKLKIRYKKMIGIEINIFLLGTLLYFICHSNLIHFIPSCVIFRKFHLLCPSCGATRAVICITNLNIKQAFYYNSLLCLLILYLIILNTSYLYDTFFQKNTKRYLLNRFTYILLFIAILLFTIIRNIL